MSSTQTRERILDKALDLFSTDGFEAVSVRNLAAAAGIKESSIYFHFANKQAILAELLDGFRKRAEDLIIPLREGTADVTMMSEERFVMLSMVFYLHFLNNEYMVRYIRLCMIEQHRRSDVAALYHDLILDMPLGVYEAAFASMMTHSSGELTPRDTALLYYGNMIYAFTAQIATGQERETAFIEMEPRLRRIYRISV